MHKLLEKEGFTYWLIEAGENGSVKKMKEDFFRLRYDEFVLNKKWEPENAEEIEKDYFDEISDFIVCYNQLEIIVAGCRLIPARNGNFFPAAQHIYAPINPSSFEISRVISRNTHAKCLLYPLIYRYAIEREMQSAYALIRKGFIELVKKEIGAIFQVIGSPVTKKNRIFFPVSIDIVQIKHLVNIASFDSLVIH